jgi:hypothetical protein
VRQEWSLALLVVFLCKLMTISVLHFIPHHRGCIVLRIVSLSLSFSLSLLGCSCNNFIPARKIRL